MTTAPETATSPSKLIAAEVRAEIARRGLTMRQFALANGLNEMWLNRRCGRNAKVDMTLEDVSLIAAAIGTTTERLLSTWLPRLDSNQQPFGYPLESPLVVAA